MLGWRNAEAAPPSRSKRYSISGSFASFSARILSATNRPRIVSCALKTMPMAPRPISASMRYFPTNSPIIDCFIIAGPRLRDHYRMASLFDLEPTLPAREPLEEGAVLLRGFAAAEARQLLDDMARVAETAPFRHLITPGGYTMSVAMTNCGRVGWVSDRPATATILDPIPARPGPRCRRLPRPRRTRRRRGGFASLRSRRLPDQPLRPGASSACIRIATRRMPGSHRLRFARTARRVSVGRQAARDAVRRLLLESGDVVVWGGPARFVYHGVSPLKDGEHPLTGAMRINLTFRKVFGSAGDAGAKPGGAQKRPAPQGVKIKGHP